MSIYVLLLQRLGVELNTSANEILHYVGSPRADVLGSNPK